jgi:hypothetical protein
LSRPDKFSRFEQAILPHLDAAYNFARWLMRDENEAVLRNVIPALAPPVCCVKYGSF